MSEFEFRAILKELGEGEKKSPFYTCYIWRSLHCMVVACGKNIKSEFEPKVGPKCRATWELRLLYLEDDYPREAVASTVDQVGKRLGLSPLRLETTLDDATKHRESEKPNIRWTYLMSFCVPRPSDKLGAFVSMNKGDIKV